MGTYLTVGQLIDGWDEFPDVAEDEEPDDGDGYPDGNDMKLLSSLLILRLNKLECLSLVSFFLASLMFASKESLLALDKPEKT